MTNYPNILIPTTNSIQFSNFVVWHDRVTESSNVLAQRIDRSTNDLQWSFDKQFMSMSNNLAGRMEKLESSQKLDFGITLFILCFLMVAVWFLCLGKANNK